MVRYIDRFMTEVGALVVCNTLTQGRVILLLIGGMSGPGLARLTIPLTAMDSIVLVDNVGVHTVTVVNVDAMLCHASESHILRGLVISGRQTSQCFILTFGLRSPGSPDIG